MKTLLRFGAAAAFAVGIAAAASAAHPGKVRIVLPSESAQFPPGPGSDLADAFCITCHSIDYVTTQPPMGGKAWKAEVTKMIGKYGASIPPAYVDPIAAYLARTYGPKEAASRRAPKG